MSTSFQQLIEKVNSAETALEAQERRFAADWRQLRASWATGWTPGRIVLAGVVSGFVIGRVEPAKSVAKGGSIMQMITAVSGLIASATAQHAATTAEGAASTAEGAADAVNEVTPPDVAAVAAQVQAQTAARTLDVD